MGLKLFPHKPIIAEVLADYGAVFLFNKTIVVFLVVSRAGKGERTGRVAASVGDDLVDKFTAVIAVELPEGEGKVVHRSLRAAVGLIEEGIEANLAGGNVVGGEGEEILAGSGLSAVVDGVNLDKTGEFSFC
jgi:hypothetical protein